MTIGIWLAAATKQLEQAGIGTARLDALVLLEDMLRRNRAQLLAHPETPLTDDHQAELTQQLARRANHEPLAYIRGKTEFYGRDFLVTPAVLEPRPESETMIDLLQKLPARARQTVVDVGTGSGALAITAALELTTPTIIATDIDPACLDVAQQNSELHTVAVLFEQTDLIQNIALSENATILANLPYVPDDYEINRAALNEPRVAIFGGQDGLDLYRRLFAQLKAHKHPAAFVLTESLPFQHAALQEIAQAHNYVQAAQEDFIQVFQLKSS